VEQLLSNYGPYAFGVVAVYFIWRFMVVPDKKMNLEQAKIHLTTAQTMKEVTQELRYSISDLKLLHRMEVQSKVSERPSDGS